MSASSALAGRAAVVTGGTRGIGAAIAAALVSRGVDVLVCGRSSGSPAPGRDAAGADAGGAPPAGRLEALQADVRDPAQARLLVERAAALFGGLDILVNNAGVSRFEELAAQSDDAWRDIVETNLGGVFHCCRAAIPALRRRGGGWIVNVSSLAGSHPFAGATAYCASKAGVDALSEALMQEVRHEGIRVCCVAPGSVDTRFAGDPPADTSWKLTAGDVARVVVDLLQHDPRSLPSRVEIRPARPRK